MSLIAFYFQMHQPFWLHPDKDKFFWEEKNLTLFQKTAAECYLPAIQLLSELIAEHRNFKFSLGMSGTFLELAKLYSPDVIKALHELITSGRAGEQVECLDESYYHSLTSLFADPQKQEFRDQVSLHRDKLRSFFGVAPVSFRNTDLICNEHIRSMVADMGYQTMLCDIPLNKHDCKRCLPSPDEAFQAQGRKLVIIPRNRGLSAELAKRSIMRSSSPRDFASHLANFPGKVLLLSYDLELMGNPFGKAKPAFNFWRALPAALNDFLEITAATPAEIARTPDDTVYHEEDKPIISVLSNVEAEGNSLAWLGSGAINELYQNIENMEGEARRTGGELLDHWRHLTTSDHYYLLREDGGENNYLHKYSNPYGSITQPAHILTRKIDYLEVALKRFSVLRRKEKTAVVMISPETGLLPAGMGDLAKYISGKTGGQGEVVSALCEGLTERGIDVHLITLNLKSRFRKEANLTEQQWRELRDTIDPQNIHLVSSSLFADKLSAYSGDALVTAAEFQKEVVNNIIKNIRARHEGVIIHSHDWMAGGAITAYAKARGFPVLHTVHNVFTADLPLDYLTGVDRQGLNDYLYLTKANGNDCLDCQATAIKNASIINFVGRSFLKEVVDDYFLDRNIVPTSVRQEVKAKFYAGAAWSIINAPSTLIFPERCAHLTKNYAPDDDFLAAKRENLLAFQQRTGLWANPDAIFFYWPSRLDPIQKGVEILQQVALPFVLAHPEVQMAIVADGVGDNPFHRNALVEIALASQGRITYQPFSEELSLLGYAAAHDVFGASLYEPCGQIDQLGNIYGATATNRDTGGYHDKIRELKLKIDGAPQDVGNGFLFRDYDAGGLLYALEKSLSFHQRPPELREAQMRRIMKEAREEYDLGKMIAAYIRIYEKLNNGKPLI